MHPLDGTLRYPLVLDGDSKALSRLLSWPFLVPLLFLLFHHGVFRGVVAFSHDAGDGLAAYKFFSFPPRYWNWLENTGQPFWLDMAWFRLQDPLWWPLLALCKALPFGTFTGFQVFLLVRIAILGVGIALLFERLGARGVAKQLGVAMALFGSVGANLFAQFGLFDLAFTFVFGLYFLLRGSWPGFAVVLISATQSYLLLLLFPFLLIAALALRRKLWRAEVLVTVAVVSLALGSTLVAVRQTGLLPILRTLRYHSVVDETGRNLTKGSDFGRNVFDTAALANRETCHEAKFCSESSWSWLGDLFKPSQSGAHYTSYLTVTGLLLAWIGFCLVPWRGRAIVASFAGFSFLLSLGSKTPLWGSLQAAFPFLHYVRHTHHLMSLSVLALILAASVALTQISRRALLVALGGLIVLELAAFEHWTGYRARTEPPEALKAVVDAPRKESFVSRRWRPTARFPSPRSGWATLTGTPAALENAPLAKSQGEARHFGAVTSFYWESYVRARLGRGDLKKTFGVEPSPVVAVSTGPVPAVNVEGDRLRVRINLNQPESAYFAVPFDAVAKLEVNGKAASFVKAQGFGVSVPLEAGPSEVVLTPKLGTRNAVFALFYGSYFLWLLWFFSIKAFSAPGPAPFPKSTVC